MRRRSIVALTLPGTCRSVKSGAWGNSSQTASRQRSPPRMPVSQSWTSAMRGAARGAADSPRSLSAREPTGAVANTRRLGGAKTSRVSYYRPRISP